MREHLRGLWRWLITGIAARVDAEIGSDRSAMIAFHAEQRRIGVTHARLLAALLLSFNLLFWLTDATVFAAVPGVQPALSEGRLAVSVAAVMIIATSWVRGAALVVWGWTAGLVTCAIVGWTMGRIGGPSSAWFHYSYPFLSLPLIAWIRPLHRIAVSTGFFGAVTVSYFGLHPQHLADPMAWSAISNLAYTALLNTLIGLYLDHLRLRIFLLDRARRGHLDALADRVAEQTRHIQALLDHTEAAREAERKALAAELHDELGQVLTGLRLMVKATRSRLGQAAAQAEFDQITLMLQHGTQTLRGVLKRLRPQILDDLGLEAAVASLVEQHRRHFTVDLSVHGDLDRLPDAVETVAYRVTQEALTNVVRHADAARVAVQVHVDPRTLRLAVRDDGIGFEPSRLDSDRLGVLGMRERARAVDGRLIVDSREGAGTAVSLTVPLP